MLRNLRTQTLLHTNCHYAERELCVYINAAFISNNILMSLFWGEVSVIMHIMIMNLVSQLDYFIQCSSLASRLEYKLIISWGVNLVIGCMWSTDITRVVCYIIVYWTHFPDLTRTHVNYVMYAMLNMRSLNHTDRLWQVHMHKRVKPGLKLNLV